MRKPFVVVSGEIGAGKTTVATALAERLGLPLEVELPEGNPFVDDRYGDPARWSFASQLWFLLYTARQHRALRRAGGVQELSVYEGVLVFGTAMVGDGSLEPREHTLLLEAFEAVAGDLEPPDLVVWLRAPVDELLRRIAARGREYERSMSGEYLAALADARRAYLAAWDRCPIIEVDTTAVDARDPAGAAELARRVEEALETHL